MVKPYLVIVSGAPAAGKTTLARRLAGDLGFPLIAKDDIKERLFETLGWHDRDWSRKLGVATFDLIYYFVETELRARRSSMVESNFRPEFSAPIFLELQAKYGFEPVQIVCFADASVLRERYHQRYLRGERHPGHMDHVVHEEMLAAAQQDEYGPMPIGGEALRVDTTDFASVDYGAILERVRAILEQSSP
jgi:predicted kinase